MPQWTNQRTFYSYVASSYIVLYTYTNNITNITSIYSEFYSCVQYSVGFMGSRGLLFISLGILENTKISVKHTKTLAAK